MSAAVASARGIVVSAAAVFARLSFASFEIRDRKSVPPAAPPTGPAPPPPRLALKPFAMPDRASVNSLGIIQSLFDVPSAIFGRVCRYW